MKELFFLTTLFLVAGTTDAQNDVEDAADTVGYPVVSGKIILGKVGFAPIPAFSFNSPILIGFLSIKKKRFSYEPDMAVGLNGIPWMANHWFRYTFMEEGKIRLNAGINPSLFFKNEWIDSGVKILHVSRNFTSELRAQYKASERASLTLTYQYIYALGSGTLSGSFLDLSSTITVLQFSELVQVNLQPQLFYFNFEGDVDGIFTSVICSVDLQKIPLSFYYQAVLPIWTGFSGTSFNWNTGLIYSF